MLIIILNLLQAFSATLLAEVPARKAATPLFRRGMLDHLSRTGKGNVWELALSHYIDRPLPAYKEDGWKAPERTRPSKGDFWRRGFYCGEKWGWWGWCTSCFLKSTRGPTGELEVWSLEPGEEVHIGGLAVCQWPGFYKVLCMRGRSRSVLCVHFLWGRCGLQIRDRAARGCSGLGSHLEISLRVQRLRFWAPDAENLSSIPGQGTRSHRLQPRVHMLQLRPSVAK